MRYMLLICADEKAEAAVAPAEMTAMVQGHMRFAEELRAAGKMVVGERLRPDADASRIRAKAGQRQVTDGPFAETKEALGGFYLIECASKQEALEWAKKIPLRADGFVDVRPVWQM
ncbi:MAG TPA: YciI family protein [Candidatus Acidoferrum sp.]|jgi:hypothetical protein|nr:YciI family protein [Candidatus Acidoferrum sp.]